MVLVVNSESEFEEVLNSNDVVVVDFYADWCGPCKMMAPIFEELSDEHKDKVFVKVNVDQNQALAQKFGVMSIPTLIIFKNGKVKERIVGAVPKEMFEAYLSD